MLEQVLASPLVPAAWRALIEKRLGRPLEPFDIWYNGFRPRGSHTEAQLDEIARQQLPDARGLRRRTSRSMLAGLGFTPERARYLAAQHRRRPGARLGPRHGARSMRGDAAPTCARASARTA